MTYLDENGDEIPGAEGGEEYLDESGEPAGASQPKTVGDWLTGKAKDALGTAVDFEKGIAKGAGETAQGAGRLVNSATSTLADLFGRKAWAGPQASGGISDAIMPGAISQDLDELKAENTAQSVGKGVEGLAEAVASGGGGALSQAARAALMAAAKKGEVGSESVLAALAAGGTAGLGNALKKGSDLLHGTATARMLGDAMTKVNAYKLKGAQELASGGLRMGGKAVEAAGKAGIGLKEAAAGYLGYEHGGGGVRGLAEGAAAAAGTSKFGAVKQLLTTPAGQRLFATVLAKIGAVSGLAPAAGVGGAALGRAMEKARGSKLGSTEYARDER